MPQSRILLRGRTFLLEVALLLVWLPAAHALVPAIPVEFSHESGFYQASFSLTLSTTTPDGTIVYTLDGSDPSEPGSDRRTYTGPISINRSTVVQARAEGGGLLPSAMGTRSYIFPAQVATQSQDQSSRNLPAKWVTANGLPLALDHNRPRVPEYERDAVYGVDSRIVQSAPNFTADIMTLPVLSMVMSPTDLFSRETGIYSNSSERRWYRPTSIEWIEVDGTVNFRAYCGGRILGDLSRREDVNVKHGFLFRFQSKYGPSRIPNTIFPDSPVPRIDRLNVRSVWGDSWLRRDYTRASLIRDQFANDTFTAMGHISCAGRFVNLFVNGLYWGVYQATERPDEAYYEEYTGISAGQWDVMKGIIFDDGWDIPADITLGAGRNGELIAGNTDSWNAMFALATSITGTATNAQYDALAEYLDMDNFIDYMILNMYAVNWDWPQKNWYAASVRNPQGGPPLRKWIFVPWDTENAFVLDFQQISPQNYTGRNHKGPSLLYRPLWQNPEFALRFADRLQKHYLGDGALATANATARFRGLVETVDRAMVGESARWGYWGNPSNLMRRDPHWLTETNRLLTEYFPRRTNSSLNQMRNVGLFPSLNAPTLQTPGGLVEAGFVVRLSASSGTIHYTTDGSDPRLRGGSISITASTYPGTQGLPPLTASTTVKARVRQGTNWSALTEARYLILNPIPAATVIPVEIHFRPNDPTPAELVVNPHWVAKDFEFLELLNVSDQAVSLENAALAEGVRLEFGSSGPTLAPGQRWVGASDAGAFLARYGFSPDAEFSGNLSNQGDTITLLDGFGNTVFSLTYQPWWLGANPIPGSSLTLLADGAPDRWQEATGWRASQAAHGTPGQPETDPVADPVAEILGPYLPLDDGYARVPWLSQFPLAIFAFPWIFHLEHHWLFPYGEADNLWLYDLALGNWVWTSRSIYPFLYFAAEQDWFFFSHRDLDQPRVFYNLRTNEEVLLD